jgi:DNA repair protein SbcC/Rad50
VRLNSLRLVNFRQHADTRVEFDVGLTGIIGANGSGKTTILEGIAYALYGVDAARGKKESIRFNRAPARASVRVELDFQLGAHRYHVVRGLTNAELYLDGATAPIANTITGVTDMLQRRLGMNRAEFFNTYFTGQKELNVMAAMGPSERAQFLSRVLGYERLRTAQGLARDRRKLIAAELTGLRAGMPDPDAVARELGEAAARLTAAVTREAEAQAQSELARTEHAAVAPRWDEAQRARDRARQAAAEVTVAEGEDAQLAREADRIARELTESAAAQLDLARLTAELTPLPELAAELQHLDALAREEGRRQALQQSERALQDELARLRERRERLASAPALEQETVLALGAAREAAEVAGRELEAKRTLWVRDRQEAETKLQALREQYAEAKEMRDRVLASGPVGMCPVCARSLETSYQSVLDMFTEQVETLGVDGQYFKRRFEQLKDTPEDVVAGEAERRRLATDATALERRLAKVQAAVQEMATLDRDITAKEARALTVARELSGIPPGYDQTRHDTVRAEVSRLAPISARAARLGAQAEREPQLRRDADRVTELRDGIGARLADLRARRDAVGFSEPDFAALRASYEGALATARRAEIAAATAHGDATAARASIEAAERRREELARTQVTVAALSGDRRLHEELDRAYTDLRTDLNFQLRPELSELASAFLTELTDARYSELELDDQYNVIVLEDGVPKPVISGGEEDLANLVLRLAISQMIAERAGQSFSLLVLDEVFGSLDESRRHNVVDLLRRLHDRFEQVILITHIESVREGLDRVISVRYDEERGTSIVEHIDGGAASGSFGAGGAGGPPFAPADYMGADAEPVDDLPARRAALG